jgi:hypothetical protein
MWPVFLSSSEMAFSPRGNLLALITGGPPRSVFADDQTGMTIVSVKHRTLAPMAHVRFADGGPRSEPGIQP